MSALRDNLLSGWPMFKRSCLQHSTARCCVTTPACLHHAGSADSRIHVPQRHRICQKEGHGCNEQAPRGALSGGRPAAAVPRHKGHMFARPLPPLHSQQRMLRLYTTSCKISKIARPCRRRQRLPASRNGAARRLSRGSRARLKEGGSSSAVLPCTRQHRQVAARWRPLRGCRAAAAPVQAFWACRPLAAVGGVGGVGGRVLSAGQPQVEQDLVLVQYLWRPIPGRRQPAVRAVHARRRQAQAGPCRALPGAARALAAHAERAMLAGHPGCLLPRRSRACKLRPGLPNPLRKHADRALMHSARSMSTAGRATTLA